MKQQAFRRVTGRLKLLSAVVGVGAVAAAAITVGHESREVDPSVASLHRLPMAQATQTTIPTELATPFARPTHTAKLCAKRQTMPC
jgi:hypothetical protein